MVTACWALCLSSVVSTSAAAQTGQPFSVHGSAFFSSGEAGGVFGAGAEFQARYTRNRWSVGGGYQASASASLFSASGISGVFIEPRYVFHVSRSARYGIYASARAARLSLEESGALTVGPDGTLTQQSETVSGSAVGVGLGFLRSMTQRWNVDGGFAVTRQSFRGSDAFIGGLAKLGLSVGFGKHKDL
jgi:hypothetical protein